MKLLFVAVAVLAGCASMNDSLTPSAKVLHDKFDDTTIVRQEPVSAAEGVSDAWHTLGFEWVSKTPKDIYVTAGTSGTTAVTGVAFNADGQIITSPKPVEIFTETEGGWSGKRFVMPMADFLKVARAGTVQMKVVQGSKYTVSTFGTAHPMATVNKKFQPFLDSIQRVGSKP